MVLGHVERGEIIPLGLDLGPFGDREAEVGENLGELVHHLADRVDRAADAFRRRQRQVDSFGREFALELGGFQRGLALGDRGGDLLAQRVDFGRFGRARLRVHRPERLQQRRDLARLAEQRRRARASSVAEVCRSGNVGRAWFRLRSSPRL